MVAAVVFRFAVGFIFVFGWEALYTIRSISVVAPLALLLSRVLLSTVRSITGRVSLVGSLRKVPAVRTIAAKDTNVPGVKLACVKGSEELHRPFPAWPVAVQPLLVRPRFLDACHLLELSGI